MIDQNYEIRRWQISDGYTPSRGIRAYHSLNVRMIPEIGQREYTGRTNVLLFYELNFVFLVIILKVAGNTVSFSLYASVGFTPVECWTAFEGVVTLERAASANRSVGFEFHAGNSLIQSLIFPFPEMNQRSITFFCKFFASLELIAFGYQQWGCFFTCEGFLLPGVVAR